MRQFTDDEIKMAEKAEEIQALRPVGGTYIEGDMRKPATIHDRTIKKGISPHDLPKDEDWYNNPKYTKARIIRFPIEVVERETGWDDNYSYPMPDRAEGDIYLPLEHQLWEMCKFETAWLGILQLHYFTETQVDPENTLTYSFWQLLLMYVMHELYGKRWDSDKEEWVKET